ncbi:YoaK family protein [Sansalvadorimonas verongulae]|uniref:YoaK family protein n=1 Tax=Sansalvadorimonas verongulae TaxID=2172824 RepID=UPI002E370F94|nr:YoaK family protein [Sansalvadorimonas verongulae]MTI14475.1 DUF1275 domain-containing protein [Sansalvadorimonas verongulae]
MAIRKLPTWVWFGGVLLTCNAGMVNAIVFMSFARQSVTHVTGSITLAGSALAQGQFNDAMHLAFVILSFFLGSVLSGIITRGSKLRLGRRYGFALLVESLMLVASMLLFKDGMAAGKYLASMACGLQNGMLTTFSSAIIRTTHLTGMVTDLGTKIGHWMTGKTIDKRRFFLYVLLICGFFTGAITGSLMFSRIGYNALMVPAMVTGFTGILYTYYVNHLRKTNGSIMIGE